MSLLGLIGKGDAPPAGDDLVKDSDTQNFVQDVIQASQTVPVVVDFWAPWCGPCKQLQPLLERVVRNAGGKVKLVKVNIDENQELAQQLRIQSIPMVYAFRQGQPIDGFAGALPESQIKAFIERLAGPIGPDPIEVRLEQAKEAATTGDLESATRLYQDILGAEPENPEALAGLARALIAGGHPNDARQLLDQVPDEHAKHAEIEGARSALSLAEEAGTLPDLATLNSRLEANPDDHEARVDLATSLFLRGQVEAAIEHLVTIVRRDREWDDGAARKQLLRIFDALGPTHPATLGGRRQLSAVLFS